MKFRSGNKYNTILILSGYLCGISAYLQSTSGFYFLLSPFLFFTITYICDQKEIIKVKFSHLPSLTLLYCSLIFPFKDSKYTFAGPDNPHVPQRSPKEQPHTKAFLYISEQRNLRAYFEVPYN